MMRLLLGFVVIICCLTACRSLTAAQEDSRSRVLVFIGTYATAQSDGIHICQLDLADGRLTRLAAVSGIRNPSFLALHPARNTLYAVSESQRFQGKPSGSVSALAIDRSSGNLRFLNEQSAEGTGPCHLAVDRQGTHLIVANYGSGSITALPIRTNGSLAPAVDHVQHEGSSVNPQRQKGPHAHCVNFDAKGRFVMSCDLGLDKVLIYRFDEQRGKLVPNRQMPAALVAPGAGPRHFAFHPDGRHAYVINELNSTVAAFQYNAEKGILTAINSYSTLPKDFEGQNSTAEIEVSADGKFLYGSNRGHNSIAVFAIHPETGALTHVSNHSTLGEVPRNFAIDPTGAYLLAANQKTNNVVVFHRNPVTGKLTATSHSIDVPKPVCVIMLAH